MDVLIKTKGNTVYKLEKGTERWRIFSRTVKGAECSSLKECFSIDFDTNEVYCNRTGNKTMGVRRFMDFERRIKKIFDITSILNMD